MKNLRVSIIQTDLFWENKIKNLESFTGRIKPLYGKSDLIVLPEMFPTGFSMTPDKLSEKTTGNVVQWMQEQAMRSKAVIAGSLIVEENECYFNRFYFVFPDGKTEYYDKRHLFRMADEHKHYTAGEEQIIIEIKGWRIRPQVCYDLRFPVWARNRSDYDMLIYVANWPGKRKLHWETLLRARAIENQAYCIGVNRIGTDGNGIDYSGDSAIYNPLGETLTGSSYKKELIETIEIDYATIERLRKGFPVSLDADQFVLQ